MCLEGPILVASGGRALNRFTKFHVGRTGRTACVRRQRKFTARTQIRISTGADQDDGDRRCRLVELALGLRVTVSHRTIADGRTGSVDSSRRSRALPAVDRSQKILAHVAGVCPYFVRLDAVVTDCRRAPSMESHDRNATPSEIFAAAYKVVCMAARRKWEVARHTLTRDQPMT